MFEMSNTIRESERAQAMGASVVITGSWAWATFDGKPSSEVLNSLKSSGWKYQGKTKRWYLKGLQSPRFGKKPMGWDYITGKYGVVRLDEEKAVA